MTTGLEGLAFPQDVPIPATYSQFVGEIIDYSIDWSAFLPLGDAIISSTWSVDGVLAPVSWPDTAAGMVGGSGTLSATATILMGALPGHGALTGLIESEKFTLPVGLRGHGRLTVGAYPEGDQPRPAGLSGDGVLSAAAAGTVMEFGLTLTRAAFTDLTTTIWVSGGVTANSYAVVNTITTAGGRVLRRPLFFRIKTVGTQVRRPALLLT